MADVETTFGCGVMRPGWVWVSAWLCAVAVGIFAAVGPWLDPSTGGQVGGYRLGEHYAMELAPVPGAAPSPCAACKPLDELREAFVRRTEGATRRLVTLRSALEEAEAAQISGVAVAAGDTSTVSLAHEIKDAEHSRAAGLAAIERLDVWRTRCQAEAVCLAQTVAPAGRVCAAPASLAAVPEILSLAESARAIADQCKDASCPLLDCPKANAVRGALAALDQSLVAEAGIAATPEAGPLETRVRGEVERSIEDIRYAARVLPTLFDDSADTASDDIAALAHELIRTRLNSIASLERAASGFSSDSATVERLWRLHVLKLDLASVENLARHALAKVSAEPAAAGWMQLADDLGSALLGTARLQTTLAAVPGPDEEPCAEGAPLAEAAAALSAALAGLDACRRRGGCDVPMAAELHAGAKPEPASLMERIAAARAALRGLTVAPSPQHTLTLGEEKIGAGEPVTVALGTAGMTCLRDAAPRISLRRWRAQTGEDLTLRPLPVPGEEGARAMVAPSAPGVYALELRSPIARGDEVLASGKLQVTAAPRSCSGFAGRWDLGESGLLVLHVNADRGQGVLSDQSGQIQALVAGTVVGDVFRGEWGDGTARGGLRLVLADDGKHLTGTTGLLPNAIAGLGTLAGRCGGAERAALGRP
ncbi:MAG: hypothetical protein GC199_06755 [Alphaproteobacteria bacterium]|nr:hypothetical protein [Alphaproteobacteria bacterium]